MEDSHKPMTCKICNVTKPWKSFCSAKKRHTGEVYRWNTCNTCHSARWRKTHRQQHLEYARNYKKNRVDTGDPLRRHKKRLERKLKLMQHISVNCCKRCGNNDIRVLCFHHRDPNQKELKLGGGNVKWKVMLLEVEKCDVLCSNCHIITHCELHHEARSKQITTQGPCFGS